MKYAIETIAIEWAFTRPDVPVSLCFFVNFLIAVTFPISIAAEEVCLDTE